jgi:hypothetical protein
MITENRLRSFERNLSDMAPLRRFLSKTRKITAAHLCEMLRCVFIMLTNSDGWQILLTGSWISKIGGNSGLSR